MAKILNAYRMITAAVIKANADIPNQGDMTVVGTTVECVNITTQKISNAIGAGVNTESGLATASGINHWSGFGPTKRTLTGGNADTREIVNSDPTGNYKQGDFAGYNHAAMTPAWYNKASAELDKWINSGDNVTFIADIDIGEVRYTEDLAAYGNIVGIALVAYEYGTSTVKAFGITSLNDCGTAANLTAVSSAEVYLQTRYTLKVFFVSSLTNLDIVCRVPNISDTSCYAKIKAATYISMTSGWNSTPYLNKLTGYVTVDNAKVTYPITSLQVYIRLFNWLDELVSETLVYNNSYSANQEIDIYNYCGMANIPDYGYRISVDFEESE